MMADVVEARNSSYFELSVFSDGYLDEEEDVDDVEYILDSDDDWMPPCIVGSDDSDSDIEVMSINLPV